MVSSVMDDADRLLHSGSPGKADDEMGSCSFMVILIQHIEMESDVAKKYNTAVLHSVFHRCDVNSWT